MKPKKNYAFGMCFEAPLIDKEIFASDNSNSLAYD